MNISILNGFVKGGFNGFEYQLTEDLAGKGVFRRTGDYDENECLKLIKKAFEVEANLIRGNRFIFDGRDFSDVFLIQCFKMDPSFIEKEFRRDLSLLS